MPQLTRGRGVGRKVLKNLEENISTFFLNFSARQSNYNKKERFEFFKLIRALPDKKSK